jgi:hypothetical protein
MVGVAQASGAGREVARQRGAIRRVRAGGLLALGGALRCISRGEASDKRTSKKEYPLLKEHTKLSNAC